MHRLERNSLSGRQEIGSGVAITELQFRIFEPIAYGGASKNHRNQYQRVLKVHSWMALSIDSNSSRSVLWDLGGGQEYTLLGLSEFEFRIIFQAMT